MMQYRYIQWDKNEKCAVFFQNVNYNPATLLSSNLLNKTDILEFFEYYFLLICGESMGISRWELNTLMLIDTYNIDKLDDTFSPNPPNPTYISEYINIIGQLFLAGYIDFGSYCDNNDHNKIDYPSNLSYYKEDKYQAWIHFRDNFICKERFNAEDFCNVSWDIPNKWSRYNINAIITPKGTKYFNEILSPRFYNKYKDLEVEIDSKGNIIRWIGEIHR